MNWTIKTAALCGALALAGGSIAAADTTSGKISDVNATAKTFTIKNSKGKSSYSLGKDAKVMVGDSASSFDALKPSERVKVDWAFEGDKRVASKVEVKPERKASNSAAPKSPAKSPTAKSPAH